MFLAVAAGAFGAHALRARLSTEQLGWWQTGVQYHAWHALGLGLVGLLLVHVPDRAGLGFAGICFIAGIVLFSGSLYAMALGAPRALGLVTPLGGAAFLLGWAAFAYAATR